MKSSDPSQAHRYSELQELSDEVLLAHLASGDHDALAVLFDRYQRTVLGVAMQVLRNPHEAEDLLQAVFLELMRHAEKFDASRGAAKTWILQFAYHRAFDRRRYLNCRGAYDAIEGVDLTGISDGGNGDDKQVSILDSARVVREALAHLTELQRRTIELAFFEGLTMHEIATQTGESYASVRHHYYRGLEKMRGVLGKHGRREEDEEDGGEMAYVRS